MSIIPCSEGCQYQYDGYCTLEETGTVSAENIACPYYKSRSADKGNCLSETSNTYKL